jgi:hypothetical protein
MRQQRFREGRSLNREGEASERGTGLALVAIVIIFGALAWGADFARNAPGWVFLVVDFFLLALLLVPTLRLQQMLLGGRDWGLLRWWGVGAGLLLALDVATAPAVPQGAVPIFGTLLAYVVSYAILFAATVGASPGRVLTRKGRDADPEGWRRFLPAVPLLIGTFAAYAGGSGIFYALDLTAIRSISEATEVASREGVTGPVEALCVGAVKPEYFAQVSQIIPLLLVALGLERRFFERLMREPVQRALTIFTVLLLCAGEAVAITALPGGNQGCGRVLTYGQEYGAFSLTLSACFIALATLAWALVAPEPRDMVRPPPEQSAQRSAIDSYQGETWMLDSPAGVCAGQVLFEYPATSVLFSKKQLALGVNGAKR